MQTTSQGKRCEFFLKAKCFFSFFFLNFPCFPGYILKEKLNDQEKVLLAAQQNTCSLWLRTGHLPGSQQPTRCRKGPFSLHLSRAVTKSHLPPELLRFHLNCRLSPSFYQPTKFRVSTCWASCSTPRAWLGSHQSKQESHKPVSPPQHGSARTSKVYFLGHSVELGHSRSRHRTVSPRYTQRSQTPLSTGACCEFAVLGRSHASVHQPHSYAGQRKLSLQVSAPAFLFVQCLHHLAVTLLTHAFLLE